MYMKIILLGILAFGLISCAPKSSKSKDAELSPTTTTYSWERSKSGPLTGSETQTVDSIVSVIALDYSTRRMTVRNLHDMEETFVVAPEVKRLNEVKVGDRIAVRHSRSIAFEVRPPTAAEIANPRSNLIVGSKNTFSLPPGVKVDSLKRMIVTVQEIDTNANTVTVKTPAGKNVIVYARNPENLSRLSVGDTVAVTFGEALAIEVKPLT